MLLNIVRVERALCARTKRFSRKAAKNAKEIKSTKALERNILLGFYSRFFATWRLGVRSIFSPATFSKDKHPGCAVKVDAQLVPIQLIPGCGVKSLQKVVLLLHDLWIQAGNHGVEKLPR